MSGSSRSAARSAVAKLAESCSDLALADHALVVLVHELDGVLDRDHVVVAVPVHEVDHRGERGRLAGARDAGDEDHAAPLHAEPVEHLGQVELMERRDALGDVAKDAAHRALRQEHVHAEPAEPGQQIADVHLLALHELAVAVLAEEHQRRRLHEVLRDGHQVVLHLEVPMNTQDRPGARLEVEVGRLALRRIRSRGLAAPCSVLPTSLFRRSSRRPARAARRRPSAPWRRAPSSRCRGGASGSP